MKYIDDIDDGGRENWHLILLIFRCIFSFVVNLLFISLKKTLNGFCPTQNAMFNKL